MKLLIFTQKVDYKDPVLGFFHDWIDRLSYHFESIEVICLDKGENKLAKNVYIHEIGKQQGLLKIKYIFKVYYFLYNLTGKYDKVFVHMNQEYVLLGGLYWKLKNIPIYLWRNHTKGNLLTKISIYLSKKVFCTSNSSYTASFKKTVLMPAGVDTILFKPTKENSSRKKYSICMVGRISPVKNIDLGVRIVNELVASGVQVSLDIIGPVLSRDEKYFEKLNKYIAENNLSSFINFLPGVSPDKLPGLYSEYQICLNLTQSGSFDKTIVEAASCGVVPLTTNTSMSGLLPDICVVKNDPKSIMEGIRMLLDDHNRIKLIDPLEKFAKSQSLEALLSKLLVEFGNV